MGKAADGGGDLMLSVHNDWTLISSTETRLIYKNKKTGETKTSPICDNKDQTADLQQAINLLRLIIEMNPPLPMGIMEDIEEFVGKHE